MKEIAKRNRVKIIALLLVAVISIFVLRPWLSAIDTHMGTMGTIDNQKTVVSGLFLGTNVASLAITAIPDDVGTPIAQSLSNMSGLFLFIITFLFLEKYMLCILLNITLGVIVPANCLFFILNIFSDRFIQYRVLMVKILACALIICLSIPTGVWIANTIQETFDITSKASIDSAVAMLSMDDSEEVEQTEESNWFVNTWKGIVGTAQTIVNKVSDVASLAKTVLNCAIEAVAVLLVVNCILPLMLFIFIYLVIKRLFAVNVPDAYFKRIGEWYNTKYSDMLPRRK